MANRKPTSTNNIKKEKMLELIAKKKECEKTAHEVVLKLIEPEVKKDYLLENAIKISLQHMEDVIEERKLAKLCGWVLCDNQIDLNKITKQTYSIRGHKVFDITERKCFCSGKCYAKAHHFKSQLLTSPLWLRDLEEDVDFHILEDDNAKELHGISVKFSNVTLSDSENENEDENQSKTISSQKNNLSENSGKQAGMAELEKPD